MICLRTILRIPHYILRKYKTIILFELDCTIEHWVLKSRMVFCGFGLEVMQITIKSSANKALTRVEAKSRRAP